MRLDRLTSKSRQALQEAHMQISDLDGIAVTRGPGLAGSLVVGVNMAKALALYGQ